MCTVFAIKHETASMFLHHCCSVDVLIVNACQQVSSISGERSDFDRKIGILILVVQDTRSASVRVYMLVLIRRLAWPRS